MRQLKSIKIPSIESGSFWIPLAISIKVCLYIVFLWLGYNNFFNNTRFSFYVTLYDTKSYFLPFDNLMKNGIYAIIPSDSYSKVARMPGYGILYFLTSSILSRENSLTFIVWLQVLASGISVYYLALLSFLITNKKGVFFIIFFLYLVSTFVSGYDTCVITESFSTAAEIIAVYLIVSEFKNKAKYNSKKIFAAGAILTWACFMRPVVITLFFIVSLYLVVKFLKSNKPSKVIYPLLLYFSFAIVCFSTWTLRNYYTLGIFMPLQYNSWLHKTEQPEKDVEYYMHKWISTIGENDIFYEYNSLGSWMYKNQFLKNGYQLPQRIFTSNFNADSLFIIREKFLAYDSLYQIYTSAPDAQTVIDGFPSTTNEQRLKAIDLNATFERYTNEYKKEHFFDYLIFNRIRIAKYFLIHSGTVNIPVKSINEMLYNKSYFQISFKLFEAFLYWVILLGGFIFLATFRNSNIEYVLLFTLTIISIFIFPFWIGIGGESRYLCMAFPFLTICAAISTDNLFQFVDRIVQNYKNQKYLSKK